MPASSEHGQRLTKRRSLYEFMQGLGSLSMLSVLAIRTNTACIMLKNHYSLLATRMGQDNTNIASTHGLVERPNKRIVIFSL